MVTLGPKKDGGPNAEFFQSAESLQGFETIRQWLQKNCKKVSVRVCVCEFGARAVGHSFEKQQQQRRCCRLEIAKRQSTSHIEWQFVLNSKFSLAKYVRCAKTKCNSHCVIQSLYFSTCNRIRQQRNRCQSCSSNSCNIRRRDWAKMHPIHIRRDCRCAASWISSRAAVCATYFRICSATKRTNAGASLISIWQRHKCAKTKIRICRCLPKLRLNWLTANVFDCPWFIFGRKSMMNCVKKLRKSARNICKVVLPKTKMRLRILSTRKWIHCRKTMHGRRFDVDAT